MSKNMEPKRSDEPTTLETILAVGLVFSLISSSVMLIYSVFVN